MSEIYVLQDNDGDGWNVWIGLEGDMPAPQGFSFIIGSGATRDEALADAVKDLEAALEQLQQPA